MKSKIIITLVILLSFSTIVVSGKSFFKDVKSDAWYYKDVAKIQEREIMNGYQDNTFQPNKPVTRAELASVINKLMDYQTNQPSPVQQFDTHVIDLVAKVTPSVVVIHSQINGQAYIGSGFIIKGKEKVNHIMTNNHVIENANNIEVTLSNGKVYPATVIMTNVSNDIALLSIPEETQLNYLEFTKELTSGQTSVIISHMLGYQFSVSKGVVSHTKRKELLQFDTSISQGSSGSPILDLHGNVLGMTTSKILGEDNIGFGVRSNVILDFLEGKSVIYLNHKIE